MNTNFCPHDAASDIQIRNRRTAGSHQRTAGTGYDDFWSVWHMTRRLNGDEVASMRYEKPTLLKIKLFSYQ